jgi:glycosyltransferase involved in cell wall biosynthesis
VTSEVNSLGIAGEVDTAHTPNAVHLRMEEADWDAATAVLAPSDAVAETFREAGFAEERLIRHQYGYRPGPRRVPPRSSEPVIDGLRAVYVGLGEPRKGLHYALDAWLASEASRTGTLTVVGRMLPAYARVLEDRLSHPSVRVIGFSSDVENALAASDVLVLPTIEEGSALVTYEAQAVGCVPLVSTAAGAMMDDGVHGLLHEPRDVGELTRQLDLLASDRSVLARMSEASIAHSPQLTWDAAGDRLARAYEEAIGIAGGCTDHHSGEVLHAVAV